MIETSRRTGVPIVDLLGLGRRRKGARAMAPTPALIAACITCLLLSGCTSPTASTPPSSPSPVSPVTTSATPSPSSSPTSTWSADQAAAIAAVDEYRAAIRPHRVEPVELLQSGDDGHPEARSPAARSCRRMSRSYLDLKKRGFRYDGDTAVVSTIVSRASKASYGTEVFVTRCIDQRGLTRARQGGRRGERRQARLHGPGLQPAPVHRRATSRHQNVLGVRAGVGQR